MSGEAIDVLGTAEKLARILHGDPAALDLSAMAQGEKFLNLFSDAKFSTDLEDLREKKLSLIKQAIDDLSDRGKVLSQAYLGLTFFEGELQPFISQYGQNPTGRVIFKVAIKDPQNPLNWAREDIHAGIYRLTVEWARTLNN